nr:MAG TPA: hypothetical protein [Caudoviricetes sp.]
MFHIHLIIQGKVCIFLQILIEKSVHYILSKYCSFKQQKGGSN